MSTLLFTEVVEEFKKNKGTNASVNEGASTSSGLYIDLIL